MILLEKSQRKSKKTERINMKKNKIVLGLVIVLLLVSGGSYLYYGVLFKTSRNIESEQPTFNISSETLIKDYNTNQKKADTKYLNKTIAIEGIVSSETDSTLVLHNTVFCILSQPQKTKLTKKNVVIKGKCIGYDELFEEVKLDQCTIIK